MKEIDLLVIGDVIIDIIVPACCLKREGVNRREIHMECGGTANTAVWASRTGIRSAFVGKAGSDFLSDIYMKDLIDEKVFPHFMTGKRKTGICVSLLDKKKERTLLVSRGANDEFKLNELPEHLLEKANYVYVAGYSFTPELNGTFKKVIDKVKKYDAKLVFGTGAYNMVEDNLKLFRDIIRNKADIVIANRMEALALTRKNNVASAAKEMKSLCSCFIITLGSEGSISYNNGKTTKIRMPRIPRVVDTTGAGDSFAGAFISRYIRTGNFPESVRFGHKIANKVVQTIGGR